MRAENAFKVLGLPITATEDEIKAAYRRLVAVHHPDRSGDSGDAAAAKMRALNDAYALARAGWGRPVDGPTIAPPKPPPRYKGPQPPPPREESAQLRADRATADEHRHRDSVLAGLFAAGFIEPAADPRRGHPAVEALLPLLPADGDIACADRYAALGVTGQPAARQHGYAFMHAVPSLAVGGASARAEMTGRIRPALLVACAGSQLLWTTSAFADDGGPFLREDIDAFAVPLRAVERAEARAARLELHLTGGTVLTFAMAPQSAAAIAAAAMSETTL